MKRQLRAGAIAVAMGLVIAPMAIGMANDPVDPVTTGTVSTAADTAVNPKGSTAFRAALGMLNEGDPVAAFTQAASLEDDVEQHTIQWAAVYFNGGRIDYAAVQQFAQEALEFAAGAVFATRIEQSLSRSEAPATEIVRALGGERKPSTVDGQILLAQAYLEQGETTLARAVARSVWVDNFLSEAQETAVRAKLGSLLDQEAHWARAMHLMMHDRARDSERLIDELSAEQVGLVRARAAVSRNDADAKALLDEVDPSLHDNPVYIFSRAQRARQFELWQSAADWLAKAPEVLPDADAWWTERRILVRKLLDVGQPRLAYEVAAGYRNGSDGRMVEALFHAGWIALSFLDDAEAAKRHFTAMATYATLPDSITQGNYWLGRANLKLGDSEAARAAFAATAAYTTVYYGQLARAELGEPSVQIRPLPAWQSTQALFDKQAIVRAVRLLAANGQTGKALPLLRQFANGLTGGGELLLAARLAQEIGAPQLAIAVAGMAEQQGVPLDSFSFPSAGVPADAPLAADRAAVFAITRQESMFQVDAVSPAGARGLMQLMPGTAEEVARKVGVDYSPGRLVSDGAYNALLGSTYLGTQLERYDGSLVLAAAAYNAGPGNANKWMKLYGDPRLANVDPVIWVELIPFAETRTYVKRVLGNYLVYREQLGHRPVTLQQALRTIE